MRKEPAAFLEALVNAPSPSGFEQPAQTVAGSLLVVETGC